MPTSGFVYELWARANYISDQMKHRQEASVGDLFGACQLVHYSNSKLCVVQDHQQQHLFLIESYVLSNQMILRTYGTEGGQASCIMNPEEREDHLWRLI
jgi:hypothetical protein